MGEERESSEGGRDLTSINLHLNTRRILMPGRIGTGGGAQEGGIV
jgi:hypothetical protein